MKLQILNSKTFAVCALALVMALAYRFVQLDSKPKLKSYHVFYMTSDGFGSVSLECPGINSTNDLEAVRQGIISAQGKAISRPETVTIASWQVIGCQ
jgi:hypothetical protein